ncbi:MAG: AAA family ATPase [Actinomycetia bacterium]|nr:AAA family ATPase [Actinomycetes bacterium]MCP4961837.1 AAA family ATPase [Actinomycetes bacterium]
MSEHPELVAEQAYIDHAYACLDAARSRATKLRSMVEVGRGGTTQARYERDVIEEQIHTRLSQLELGSASLVFGRVDTVDEEVFHIGRLAVADEHQEPVVVDWRAPVAEPFYRATGREAMGLILRRHFVTRGRQLLDMEDELFDLDRLDDTYQGHGALVAALEQNRSGQLRDIVATIQGEQDKIIRDELKGTVIVQGGPGTGKTVVALHRAAYLLYTHRFPLEGQGVLVLGPNRLFLRYIERVLPSLGEAGVHLSVLADLIADLFPDTRVRLSDAPEQARIKGDLAMIEVVRRAVRDRQRRLRESVVVPFGVVRLRLSIADSAQIVSEARRRFRNHNRARTFVENEVFRRLADSHRSKPDPEVVRSRLFRDRDVKEALEWIWPVLTPHQLLRDLFGSKALLRSALAAGFPQFDEIELDSTVAELHRERGDSLTDYVWADADVAVLDEAHSRLGTLPANKDEEEVRTYGHIVIDEAQDHSPMALRMVARRSLNGSFTIVGDIAQATAPGASSSWGEVLDLLPTGRLEPRIRDLTLSYRIPAPNLRLALKVLAVAAPDLSPPTAVREKGAEPTIERVDPHRLLDGAIAAALDELSVLDGGSVAIIAPDSLIDELDRRLAASGVEYGRATNASRNVTGSLHPELALVPVTLVKGLELDGSVVVEPGRIVAEQPQGLRALYVALTRSTKRLAVVHSEELPEPLGGLVEPASDPSGPLTLF